MVPVGRRPVTMQPARVAQQLGTVEGQPRLVVGRPAGGGWWTVSEAAAGIETWFAPLADQHGDRRLAAAYVSSWLAGAPAVVVGLCAVLGGVAPLATGDRVWVHRHPGGWVDRYAIDPVELVDQGMDEVLAAAGRHVAELAGPVVERACDQLPIGRAAVWGGVADTLTAYALMFARQHGRDEREDWRRCEVLLDGLQRHAPLRTRPRPFPVAWSAGSSLYPVRGTCCLYYRSCADPEPDGDGYCTTCPLRTDTSRTARLVAHLESTT